MKRLLFVLSLALTSVGATATTGGSAHGTGGLCVGNGPGCFATIQAALDAAPDGATIRILAGTFSGGITIEKSVQLKGVGAARTIVRGGGPVLTIGTDGAATEPTVSISGLTVTGGVNTGDGTVAFGGGILIPARGGRRHRRDSHHHGQRHSRQPTRRRRSRLQLARRAPGGRAGSPAGTEVGSGTRAT